MLPPDYFGALDNPTILQVFDMVIRFYAFMFIGMMFNVAYFVGSVWWMLFICRAVGIPWIDGTTRGFATRSKE